MKNHIQSLQYIDDNSVVLKIKIDAESLLIDDTPFGVRFDLGAEFKNSGEPDTPSLPSKIIQVALPANTAEIRVFAHAEKFTKLSEKPMVILPQAQYRVAANTRAIKPDNNCTQRLKYMTPRTEDLPRSIPHAPSSSEINPETYSNFFRNPPPLASLKSTIIDGANTIASIQINPITIDKEYIPQLNELIEIKVSYSTTNNVKVEKYSTVRSLSPNVKIQSATLAALKNKVVNPTKVIDISRFPWELFGSYDYLVITDNYQWNSDTIERTTEVGDMTTPFKKIIDWKKEKGLKARLVTITDIVDGRFGNFKENAVDLQEVIRNFLKYAHRNWGVSWCLLGGDTEILPIRQAAGEIRGDVNEQSANNPPAVNEAFWTGTFLKVNAVSLGEWFNVNDSYLKLTNKNTGQLIPKKSPSRLIQTHVFSPYLQPATGAINRINLFETDEQFRNRLGWHFCTDNTYTTYSSSPTTFIRVDGPASIIHAPLRFHYTWNTIPTDFYYASLFGPNYSLPGRHDWDYNNNRIYGQHELGVDFDPINWNSDIIVGRAAVSSPADADNFVNKVIAYEKFSTTDGTRLDRNYVDKMLLVSENWGGRLGFWSTPSNPPEAYYFHTLVAQGKAILQTPEDSVFDWNWQLIAWVSDTDVRVIPYNQHAGATSHGWHYAKSATDLSPAVAVIHMPWGQTIELPYITHTLVIYGNTSDIAPSHFILDSTAADGSMMDQEALRQQVDAELSVINRFSRLYEDIESLPLSNQAAAPLDRISASTLAVALNSGQHFVSLSGHGYSGGCCSLESALAQSITNTNKLFIAFADSCLTNDFTTMDSMSEHLLTNTNGGAVAYVGHTRFSWIGVGDDYQRAFFHELTNTRHLGLMHNSRLQFIQSNPSNHYHKWSVLALNLLGDPEMEVWDHKPFRLGVDILFDPNRLIIKAFREDDLSKRILKNVEVLAQEGENLHRFTLCDQGTMAFAEEWFNSEKLTLTINVAGGLPYKVTAKEIGDIITKFKNNLVQEASIIDTDVYSEKQYIKNPEISYTDQHQEKPKAKAMELNMG